MTTSRIVRGSKTRVFLYICAVLILTGIIACYNNTLSQLQESRNSNEICHQQEENLSTQLQVISDYKQRLEKSLKTEKAEHQQLKIDLENKLNEEKTKNEKSLNDVNLRLISLQQHFNLLQTQHDDYKEECSKTKNQQLQQINSLKAQLSEMEEKLKKVENSKENLKSQYLKSQVDYENLQKQLQQYSDFQNDHDNITNHLKKENIILIKQIEDLKRNCNNDRESLQAPHNILENSSVLNNISKQMAMTPEQLISKPSLKNKTEEQVQPNNEFIKPPSKSTTSSIVKVSRANLNGARPLLIPTVTPKSLNRNNADSFRLPEGVVPPPLKLEQIESNQYKAKSDIKPKTVDQKKAEEIDRENVANEVFDAPHHNNNGYDEQLGFADAMNAPDINKKNGNKEHIDKLAVPVKDIKNYDGDYKDNQNEMQLEDNDPEDDDGEDYGDRLGRIKDPAVRN